jgi:hypothetical protein
MQLRIETQLSPVADEVSALMAIARPVLRGLLYSLPARRIERLGGIQNVTLEDLARERRASDGDCGVCFEYAVHEAVSRNDPMVVERVDYALRRFCRISGDGVSSILFGAEKQGSQRLIATAKALLTEESRLMYGTQGRPVQLRRHLDAAAAAFRTRGRGSRLPQSISGLWKADLFLGQSTPDRWVGTSVKINASALEPARGLRLGIVPAKGSDLIHKDERRNLIVVPLRWDDDFMDIFYAAWTTVVYVLSEGANMPAPGLLHNPAQRNLGRLLASHKGTRVLRVIAALEPLGQPHLLEPQEVSARLESPDVSGPAWHASVATSAVIAPVPADTVLALDEDKGD